MGVISDLVWPAVWLLLDPVCLHRTCFLNPSVAQTRPTDSALAQPNSVRIKWIKTSQGILLFSSVLLETNYMLQILAGLHASCNHFAARLIADCKPLSPRFHSTARSTDIFPEFYFR